MVLLFLLIISLFFVFVGLHFNYPGIIQHHVFALVCFPLKELSGLSIYNKLINKCFQGMSFPIALCTVIAGIATGGPFLVAFLIVLYFGALLPFAYIYASAEWTTTEIKDVENSP